ncbi:MAG TPA: SRPBCC domain-containing protein [Acidimicrobiales bacterium]|nr:SRPBCC domain-containing protein [Acidimicrobiales bacterium]
MTTHRTRVRSGVVEVERRIDASPETVFAYFTDPERYRLWQGVDAELDPRPGGMFKVAMTGHSHQIVRGQYLEVDAPWRVVFTWGYEGNVGLLPGVSKVEVILEPDGQGTLLRIRHGALPSDAACQIHAWGWDLSLDRLVAAAERRDPGPNPFTTL